MYQFLTPFDSLNPDLPSFTRSMHYEWAVNYAHSIGDDVALNRCSCLKGKHPLLSGLKPLHNTPQHTSAALSEVSLLSALVIGHNRHVHVGVQRSVRIYYVGLQPFRRKDGVISDERQKEARGREIFDGVYNREGGKCAGKSHNTKSVPEFASIYIF